jgi:dTMP kinase
MVDRNQRRTAAENQGEMAGRFITFEGGEGAGKSTQIRLLAARLTEHGQSVVTTREPGGTPTAEAIRRVLLSGLAEKLGAEGEAVLFAAARADHVDQVIAPALKDGKWVLCDRFFDSTRVYQGMAGGADAGLLNALERVALAGAWPDLTVIIDVPATVGLARAAQRAGAEGSPDRFERDDIAVHEQRRAAFLSIARGDPRRCVVVDGTASETATADAIWQAVTARLIERAA